MRKTSSTAEKTKAGSSSFLWLWTKGAGVRTLAGSTDTAFPYVLVCFWFQHLPGSHWDFDVFLPPTASWIVFCTGRTAFVSVNVVSWDSTKADNTLCIRKQFTVNQRLRRKCSSPVPVLGISDDCAWTTKKPQILIVQTEIWMWDQVSVCYRVKLTSFPSGKPQAWDHRSAMPACSIHPWTSVHTILFFFQQGH